MSVLRLFLNGQANIAPWLQELSVEMVWGGGMRWDASFLHHTNGRATMPNPFCPPGSGSFADMILPHKFDQDRFLDLTVGVAGETTIFPRFLPGDPDFDHPELRWGGTDLSGLRERESEAQPDILYDGGGVQRTSHQAIQEHATLCGYRTRIEFPSFDLRELRRGSGGTPRSWDNLIAQVYQVDQQFEHPDTLVFKRPDFDPDSGAYDWAFIDNYNMTSGQLKSNADSVKNSFIGARIEPQGGLLGEQEIFTPQSPVGRTGSITFSRPTRSFTLEATAVGGALEGFTAYNSANRPTAISVRYSNSFVCTNGPAVRLEFNFKHDDARRPIYMGYRVEVYGGVKSGGSFSFPFLDADNAAQIGERKEIRAIEMPLPVDAATCQAGLRALLEERVRRTWELPVRTPFANPKIRPGHRVLVQDWLNGINLVWFVQRCRWLWSRGASDLLEMTLIRPWI